MYIPKSYETAAARKDDLHRRLAELRTQSNGTGIQDWQEAAVQRVLDRFYGYFAVMRTDLIGVAFSEKLDILDLVTDIGQLVQWELPSTVIHLPGTWIPLRPLYHSYAEEALNWSVVSLFDPDDAKQFPSIYRFIYTFDKRACVNRAQWLFGKIGIHMPYSA